MLNVTDIRITVTLYRGAGFPVLDTNLSVESVTDVDEYVQQVTLTSGPVKSIKLANYSKTSADTIVNGSVIVRDQRIVIESISVNNILLDKMVLLDSTCYTPVYTQDNVSYAGAHGIDLLRTMKTFELCYNGEWCLPLQEPFFVWYNSLIRQHYNKYDYNSLQGHIGSISPDKMATFKQAIASIVND